MFELGYFVFNLTMVLTTIWITHRFLGTFFEKKNNRKSGNILWILYVLFQLLTEFHKGNASVIITFVNMLLVFLIAFFCYHKTGIMKILIVILLNVVWLLLEMMVYYSIGIFLDSNDIRFDLLGSFLSKLIMMIFVNFVSIYWKGKYNEFTSITFYVPMFIISIGSIFVSVMAFFTQKNTNHIFFPTITFCILLFVNIYVFEMFTKIKDNFLAEREKAIYAQQISMMSNNTEEQKKMMSEFYKEKHDLVNKLIVIREYIVNGSTENQIESLDNIINICNNGDNILNCGNSTIDAIINFKYSMAKEKEIEFDLNIFIPEELPFEGCDIGIILGNAIDNAIEATQKCKWHHKTIRISIGIKKNSFVLVIKNPYENTIRYDKNEQILTTKSKSYGHGYGLKSINKVVEKYNGEMCVFTEDNYFSLTVILNVK